jgi:hypothetical protein
VDEGRRLRLPLDHVANSALASDAVTLSMAAWYCGGSRDVALRSVVGAAAMKSSLFPDSEPPALPALEDVVDDVAHTALLSAGEQRQLLNIDVQSLSELSTSLLEEARFTREARSDLPEMILGRSTRGCQAAPLTPPWRTSPRARA